MFGGLNWDVEDFNTTAPLAQGIAGAANAYFSGAKSAGDIELGRIEQDRGRVQNETMRRALTNEYGRIPGVSRIEAAASEGADLPTLPTEGQPASEEFDRLAAAEAKGLKYVAGDKDSVDKLLGKPAVGAAPKTPPPTEGPADSGVDTPEWAGAEPPAATHAIAEHSRNAIVSTAQQDPRAWAVTAQKLGLSPAEASAVRSGVFSPDVEQKLLQAGSIPAFYGTKTPEFLAQAAKEKENLAFAMQKARHEDRMKEIGLKGRFAGYLQDKKDRWKPMEIARAMVTSATSAATTESLLNQPISMEQMLTKMGAQVAIFADGIYRFKGEATDRNAFGDIASDWLSDAKAAAVDRGDARGLEILNGIDEKALAKAALSAQGAQAQTGGAPDFSKEDLAAKAQFGSDQNGRMRWALSMAQKYKNSPKNKGLSVGQVAQKYYPYY